MKYMKDYAIKDLVVYLLKVFVGSILVFLLSIIIFMLNLQIYSYLGIDYSLTLFVSVILFSVGAIALLYNFAFKKKAFSVALYTTFVAVYLSLFAYSLYYYNKSYLSISNIFTLMFFPVTMAIAAWFFYLSGKVVDRMRGRSLRR